MSDIFELIDGLKIVEIEKSLKDKTVLKQVSFNGLKVFPYAINKFLDIEAKKDSYLVEDSQIKDKIIEICSLILEAGADYHDRLGKTNRSIKISDRIKRNYPDVHQEWNDIDLRNKILNMEDISEALSSAAPRKKRKF